MISAGPPLHHGHFCANCAPRHGALPYPFHASCQGCGVNCGPPIYAPLTHAVQPVHWKEVMTPKKAAARHEQASGIDTNTIVPPTLFAGPPTGTWTYGSIPWAKDSSNPNQFDPAQPQPTTWKYVPHDMITAQMQTAYQPSTSTAPKPKKSKKKSATTATAPSKRTTQPSDTKNGSKSKSTPYLKPTAPAGANNSTADPSTAPPRAVSRPRRVVLPLTTDHRPSTPPIVYQTLTLLLQDLNRILCTPHEGLPFQFSGTCSVVADAARVRNGDHYRMRVSQVGWEVIARTVLAFDVNAVRVHESGSVGAIALMRSAAIWMGAPPDPRLRAAELERPCGTCEHLLKIRVWEDSSRAPIAGESILVDLVHYES
ncbi:hypothetical protein B0H16DRAFT_1499787 [Mycena metata]|uniref:Uncharacterized protein n=1 Tax=Mycena metata TaxID=1033252 RepID=A0AAD7NY31_9AGAR|nr:hypothetical protein B0H16DRAFT_1499787 [Mycena metata]